MGVDYQAALLSYDPDWQRTYEIYDHLGRRRKRKEIPRADLLRRLTNLWASLDRTPPRGHMEWDIKRCWREWYDREAEAVLKADYPERWRDLREREMQEGAVTVAEHTRRTAKRDSTGDLF